MSTKGITTRTVCTTVHTDARYGHKTWNRLSRLSSLRPHDIGNMCPKEKREVQRGQATSPRVHSHEAADQRSGSSQTNSRTQSLAYDTSLPLSPHLCLPLSPWPRPSYRPVTLPLGKYPNLFMGLLLPIPLGFFHDAPWSLSLSHSTALHGSPVPQCCIPGPRMSAQCAGPQPSLLTLGRKHRPYCNATAQEMGPNPSSATSKLGGLGK